jgi:hypothetical protein
VVVYRHELFQKGNLDLLSSMSTKRKKKEEAEDTTKRTASEDTDMESETERKDTSEETDFGLQIDDERQGYSEGSAGGTEEEKVQSVGPQSPLRLPRHLQSMQDAESKSDMAPDSVRQQMQQQLSLTSSLVTHRMTSHPAASLSRERPPVSAASTHRDHGSRQLLESLIAQETQQHQRQQQLLEFALLRRQQESLAREMVVQRHLAEIASANRIPMHQTSTITVEQRLVALQEALQDPTLRGIHHLAGGAGRIIAPSRSLSMSDLPAAVTAMTQRNLSDLAARLALQQAQNQAADFGASLSSRPQNLSELRAAMEARSQAEIASALHLMASPSSPAQTRLALSSDERMPSLGPLSPRMAATDIHTGLDNFRSFPDVSSQLQMQLELELQLRQAQLRRASSADELSVAASRETSRSSLGAAASLASASRVSLDPAPLPANQQLLEMFLERQRLQQQLQDEHQRRRQGR